LLDKFLANKNLDRTVDLVLIDGWGHLALDVLKLIDSFIHIDGIVICDNVSTFKQELRPYVEFLQNPDNGYRSTTLNLKGGTEFSVKVR
jgi:predicted O-methyltransferase YrrM